MKRNMRLRLVDRFVFSNGWNYYFSIAGIDLNEGASTQLLLKYPVQDNDPVR